MKQLFLLLVAAFIIKTIKAQSKIENIIIVTTDGLRWQEVFKGVDSAIAINQKFNEHDSAYIFKKYWAASAEERRKKLFPFLWNTVATQGQLHGNRMYGNKVNNANPYQFSYPGYNEIFTGYPDPNINTNGYMNNPHTTVLEFLNALPAYKGKVAAFGAWEAFNRIFNEPRCGFPVVAAFDSIGGQHPNGKEKLLNEMLQNSYKPWLTDECLDVFTHFAAKEYLAKSKPKIIYIAYGETDEWAHAAKYRSYLDAAHQVDNWLQDLWSYVQSDGFYKNKTAIFITVDHGRGDAVKEEWTSHGEKIRDAGEIWFAVMAPNIKAAGEVKTEMQLYQKQFAQTIASFLGYKFTAPHPIAEAIQIQKK